MFEVRGVPRTQTSLGVRSSMSDWRMAIRYLLLAACFGYGGGSFLATEQFHDGGIHAFLLGASSRLKFGGAEAICIVNQSARKDTIAFAKIAGTDQADRSNISCGSNLEQCCPSLPTTPFVLVTRSGNKLGCRKTTAELKPGQPDVVCASAAEIDTLRLAAKGH